MVANRIGWNNTLAMSQYTDTFKTHRTNIAKVAGSTTSLNIFNRVQEEESVHFLLNVLESPENLFDHIKREAGAVILKITYGYTAEPKGKDVLVDMAVKTMSDFSDATIPGKWPVDIMPFRKSINISYTHSQAHVHVHPIGHMTHPSPPSHTHPF
jgi:hypothetical protein